MLCRLWLGLLILSVHPVALFGLSRGLSASAAGPQGPGLEARERQVWTSLGRDSQFSDVPHGSAPRCEDVQPPQALTTPNPLFTPIRNRSRVKVSFIIGTDGHVHSPLILESAGPVGDRSVLRAVRSWRFRPATCNGVPTETEGKIEFSSR